jgi:hypothetical protein
MEREGVENPGVERLRGGVQGTGITGGKRKILRKVVSERGWEEKSKPARFKKKL